MKKKEIDWKIYDAKPLRISERIDGRWDEVISLFKDNLVIDKSGASKWICFKFADYKDANSAANAIRQVRAVDAKMPYGYSRYWHVVCSVHSYGGVNEVWAQKIIRQDKKYYLRHHVKNAMPKVKNGDTVINRLGKKYLIDGVWPEIRWAWSNSDSFCVCEECVQLVGKNEK